MAFCRAQEDVAELKREYQAAVNALGASLTEHDIQKVCTVITISCFL